MKRQDQAVNSRQQSYTPSLISRAVIADTGFELSLEPATGPARKLRVRPHTEQKSWWLIEHIKTTDSWRVAGVEPIVNVDLTILAAVHRVSNE